MTHASSENLPNYPLAYKSNSRIDGTPKANVVRIANTGRALSCDTLKAPAASRDFLLSAAARNRERLDPPEIKRRPGLAIRSEC
jgi:hypothetical protein